MTLVLIASHLAVFLFGYICHKLITSKLHAAGKAALTDAETLKKSAETEAQNLAKKL